MKANTLTGIGQTPTGSISRDPEFLIGAVLILGVLAIGIITAPDYGITTDEFMFDPYGPLAISYYASGFTDRTLFGYTDAYLYGPWFQMLVAAAQSLHLADPYTVRHAVTFIIGLGGIAALLPIGRLAIGPWAGLAAVVLCLTTGYLYGHLFFTPNDIPFLAAMTWVVLAIIAMARTTVPAWGPTIAAGLLSGLAISTRFGGLLAEAYLLGGMVLCMLEAMSLTQDRKLLVLSAIAVRTVAALVIGLITAIAIWPWLQGPHPLQHFLDAYDYFIRSYVQFQFSAWGERISSAALPWHYIPGQLLARLPEGFVALLAVAGLFGVVAVLRFADDCRADLGRSGLQGLRGPALALAQARGLLIIAVAALGPAVFIVARHAVIFDGIRHVLFIVPMLALLASWALCKLMPLLVRLPTYAVGIAALHIVSTTATMVYLHPLEYVAVNAFAGGVAGAAGRFDLDYWSAAATEAVRRLEARLTEEPQARFAVRAPRVMVCIGWRESVVAPLFSQPWTVVTKPEDADFLIETERDHCPPDGSGIVFDQVERFGVTFARTIELPPAADDGR